MDFLKELLGEELFKQIESKINEHNGNEANADKQIKIANIGGGDYVGKGKYDSEIERLTNLLNSKTSELDSANKLIADLNKGTKGNEDLQNKINAYETDTIPKLQKQLRDTEIKAALKVALLSEKAVDVDYLTFKLNERLTEQGKNLELDENGNIKGWEDVISGLKTQFPAQFESANGGLKVEPKPLPTPDDNKNTITQEDFNKMGYASRVKLKEENPELYNNLKG